MVYTINIERSLDHKTLERDTQLNNLRAVYLNQKFKKSFKFYRFIGLLLVEYDFEEGAYKPMNSEFVKKYILHYLCILAIIGMGIVLALCVQTDLDFFKESNSMILMFLFMNCITVIPFTQLYSMRLLLVFLPEAMMMLAKLSFDLKNAEMTLSHPMKVITAFTVPSPSKIKEDQVRAGRRRNWILYLPLGSICLSLSIFLGLFIVGMVYVIDLQTILVELPTYCLQFALLYFPFLLNLVCLSMMDCCRAAYCSINTITKRLFETIQKDPKSKKALKTFIVGLCDIHLKLKQTVIFMEFIEKNFLKYLHSVCIFTYLVCCLLSCVKIMNNIESLLHLFPLLESFYMIAVLCCQAEEGTKEVIGIYIICETQTTICG